MSTKPQDRYRWLMFAIHFGIEYPWPDSEADERHVTVTVDDRYGSSTGDIDQYVTTALARADYIELVDIAGFRWPFHAATVRSFYTLELPPENDASEEGGSTTGLEAH
jgi:hypothetical protein